MTSPTPGPPSPRVLLRALFAGDSDTPAPAELGDICRARALIDAARALRAGAMMYSSLKRRGWLDLVDAADAAQLRAEHAATAAQNMALEREASLLLEQLGRAGADAVPLKGLALQAGDTHRDIGARPTCDIDILTHRRDRRLVERALSDRGYAQTGLTGPPKHLPAFTRGQYVVEVHEFAYWRLSDGSLVDLDGFRAGGDAARLAHTVVHLVHHLFHSSIPTGELVVKTLWDLNEVSRHVAADASAAQRIASEASSAGLATELGLLADTLAELVTEPNVGAWGAGTAVADVARLVDTCKPSSPAADRVLELRYLARMLGTAPIQVRAETLRQVLIPRRAAMEAIYGLPGGSPWVWPAYLLRPAHLAWRTAGATASLVASRLRR